MLSPLAANAGGFRSLYSFVGGSDGQLPVGGPVLGQHNAVLGATSWGGQGCTNEGRYNGCGVIYEVDRRGFATTLYAFSGPEGEHPNGDLVRDASGTVFGVTTGGGGGPNCFLAHGCGAAFRLAQDGTFTKLHAFAGGLDGAFPNGGLVADPSDNLYGVTLYGGLHKGQTGYGTVYKITPDGTTSVLYAFQNEADGQHPSGRLAIDGDGNLYGTVGDVTGMAGGVFKLEPNGTFTMLHAFTGGASDGSEPFYGVTLGPDGTIYGATYNGGASNLGTVFKITTGGTESVLHSFAGGADDGSYPNGGLTIDGGGNLYGVTQMGGSTACHLHVGCGALYRVTPDGTASIVHAFHNHDGKQPTGTPVLDSNGNLRGATSLGGASGLGTTYIQKVSTP
jgi:uncharacterized repeat protein (TIGR03803 family)